MKKSLLFLAMLLLVSCQGAGTSLTSPSDGSSTSTTSESQSSSNTSSSESTTSEDPIIPSGTIDILPASFPEPVSGGYPEDGSFTVDEIEVSYSKAMQGGGDYENTIQMRKENSYVEFTSETLLFKEIEIVYLDTTSEYNPYMAHLHIQYDGTDLSLPDSSIQEDKLVHETFTLPTPVSTLRVANVDIENPRAAYVSMFSLTY